MRKLVGTLVLVAIVVVGVLLLPATRSARSQPKATVEPLLRVCQDESTLEKAIEAYLRVTKGVTDREIGYNDKDKKQDMLVAYPVSVDNAPNIRVVIDTMVAEKDKDGKVRERVIGVQTFYILPASAKTPQARQKILELCNTWMCDHWSPGCIFLDEDGDLCLRTVLNIPGPDIPVHAEMVFDAIARMRPVWQAFYPLLDKELKLSGEKKDE
jgi:hypothetical protein